MTLSLGDAMNQWENSEGKGHLAQGEVVSEGLKSCSEQPCAGQTLPASYTENSKRQIYL